MSERGDFEDVRVRFATLRQEDADTWRNWTKSKRFWGGVLAGFLAACIFDLTDLHICAGECDGSGYDIVGPRR